MLPIILTTICLAVLLLLAGCGGTALITGERSADSDRPGYDPGEQLGYFEEWQLDLEGFPKNRQYLLSIRDLLSFLEEFDEDRNGRLEPDEYAEFMHVWGPQEDWFVRITEMTESEFARWDEDEDGVLDREEFRFEAVQERNPDDEPLVEDSELMGGLFDMLDVNCDGLLTLDEWSRNAPRAGAPTEAGASADGGRSLPNAPSDTADPGSAASDAASPDGSAADAEAVSGAPPGSGQAPDGISSSDRPGPPEPSNGDQGALKDRLTDEGETPAP